MENAYIINFISYGLNIVFVTWGVVSILKDFGRDKHAANYFNSVYEMADRLATELGTKYPVGQVRDIASFLKSATMNFMKKQRNEVDRKKKYKFWERIKHFFFWQD